MAEEVEWFVGIDWASQSHQVCLIDAHGECLGERAVAHGWVNGDGLVKLHESSPDTFQFRTEFAADSLLEEDGFELAVPRRKGKAMGQPLQASIAVFGPECDSAPKWNLV
jgi:hypothetical protein